ncbi:MAG: N-acetylmuramoyl-L-alanine amidase [Pseudohongiellaceae bacterium]|jgi:N-acetylmuramoyl-L-alanine amidase
MKVTDMLILGALLSSMAAAQAASQIQSQPPVVEILATGTVIRGEQGLLANTVACARSHDGQMTAWLNGRSGLIIEGWLPRKAFVAIPAGAFPRFTSDGRLVIASGDDDGHHLSRSATWVLDPGQTSLRPPHPGEDIPAWQAPGAQQLPPIATAGSALIRVAVDAGHGGTDSGAVGNGLLEKDLNLDVTLRLANLLAADTADTNGGGQWDVLLTRPNDVFVSLQQRVTLANSFGAASFVSVHTNSFTDPAANGTETYAWAEGTTAAALRDKIHNEMIAAWGLTDRGTKTANFYVLVNTSMPASLSEMGFITNSGDAVLLASPVARQDMALAHLFAMQAHHGLPPYEPGGGPVAGTLKGILYNGTVGVGAPIANGTVALSNGSFTSTNASGFYSFALNSGTYQFAGTAPGFAAGQASETVTSGDVWESLGLTPTGQPTLTLSTSGNDLDLDINGDQGSLAWLLFAVTPGLPLASVGTKGLLWPDAATMTIVPLTNIPSGGNLHVDITLPSFPGVNVHCQAFAGHQGFGQLSNGAAFTLP